MGIEDVLEPGERLIWKGRPRAPGVLMGMRVHEALIVVAIVAAIGYELLPVVGLVIWEDRKRTGPPIQGELIYSLGPVATVAAGAFLFLVVLALAMRLVAGRIEYAITDRRILCAGPGVPPEGGIPRSQVNGARVEGRSLVIETTAGAVRFDGIADAELARSALDLD